MNRIPPSPHRQALVVWLCIYPTITLLLALFGPSLAALPLPLRTFVLTAVLVPLLTYVLVPRAHRVLNRLIPRRPRLRG
ncbi:MAG: hypothetical protein AAF928_13145 [Myxococcota bacterium]